MRMFTRVMAVVALLAMGAGVQAGIVTGPPTAGFTTAGAAKDLSLASGTYSVDLSTSATFTSEVHSIVGFVGGAGTADLRHETDAGAGFGGISGSPSVLVGTQSNGNQGAFAYKFVLPSGVTDNATVVADVFYRGFADGGANGDNTFIGVASSLTIGGSLQNFVGTTYTDTVTGNDLFGPSGGFGNFQGTANLVVPDGLTEFYVVVSDTDPVGAGSTINFGILNLTATTTPIPEPTSLILTGLGMISLLGFNRRRR